MNGIEAACVGRLRKDAEIRVSKSGREWLAIPLIVGEGDDEQYIAASSFSMSLAELAPQLKAGTECYVEGKIKVKLWDNNGTTVPSIWLTASIVQPMGLIGTKRPKKPRSPRGVKTKVGADPQAPLELDTQATDFNDPLPF